MDRGETSNSTNVLVPYQPFPMKDPKSLILVNRLVGKKLRTKVVGLLLQETQDANVQGFACVGVADHGQEKVSTN